MSGLDISDVPEVQRRPTVTVEPCVNFGRPTVRGRPVVALARTVWGGQSVLDTAEDFGLTRAEVLAACWFMGRYGINGPAYVKRWGAWAAAVESDLWHSRFDVPDPPAKEE